MNWLKDFVNETEMVSFSGFLRAIIWSIVVLAFTITACIIMLRDGEHYVTWGFQLAGIVLAGLGFTSAVGAYNTRTVRHSAKEYAPVMEAKERAKRKPPVNVENVESVTVQSDEGV